MRAVARNRAGLLALGVLAVFAGGCLEGGSVDPAPDGGDGSVAPAYAQVVVAVIDSGTNPYHEHFAGDVPTAVVSSFVDATSGQAPETVDLSHEGDYDARVAADEDLWATLEPGRLYHFAGTRLLGISFGSDVPVLDDNGSSHGTATSGSVLDANPDAIVVLVEGDYAAGEAWAAAQPWIDITSMSYGPPGSVPGMGAVFGLDTHTHTRSAWEAGKIPVGAADNTPSLAPNDETAGPPWVLGVAGDHPEDFCREHVSGTFPDFTADFTQDLPEAYDTEGRRTTSGTSFSTPMTAGTVSAVVQQVRAAWNHTGGITDGALALSRDGQRLTNADVRAALERTAYYFEFDTCPPDPTAHPVNPAAPWLQMGWGHVGPEIVNATVAHLLGTSPAPAKDAGAVAFQGAVLEYRRVLWEQILP